MEGWRGFDGGKAPVIIGELWVSLR